jgi:hypothetical protein
MKLNVKQSIFLFIFCTALFANCRNEYQKSGFNITGEIKGVDNKTIILSKVIKDKFLVLDSCQIQSSEFSFTGFVETPELYYISDKNVENYFPLFVENSDIQIKAKNIRFENLEISGSESHQQFLDFMVDFSVYQDKYNYFTTILINQRLFENASGLQNDSTFYILKKERMNFLKNYVTTNYNSVVSAYITNKILINELTKDEIVQIISVFSPSVQKSVYYKLIVEFLNNQSLLTDKNYYNQYKLVIINSLIFFTTRVG